MVLANKFIDGLSIDVVCWLLEEKSAILNCSFCRLIILEKIRLGYRWRRWKYKSMNQSCSFLLSVFVSCNYHTKKSNKARTRRKGATPNKSRANRHLKLGWDWTQTSLQKHTKKQNSKCGWKGATKMTNLSIAYNLNWVQSNNVRPSSQGATNLIQV